MKGMVGTYIRVPCFFITGTLLYLGFGLTQFVAQPLAHWAAMLAVTAASILYPSLAAAREGARNLGRRWREGGARGAGAGASMHGGDTWGRGSGAGGGGDSMVGPGFSVDSNSKWVGGQAGGKGSALMVEQGSAPPSMQDPNQATPFQFRPGDGAGGAGAAMSLVAQVSGVSGGDVGRGGGSMERVGGLEKEGHRREVAWGEVEAGNGNSGRLGGSGGDGGSGGKGATGGGTGSMAGGETSMPPLYAQAPVGRAAWNTVLLRARAQQVRYLTQAQVEAAIRRAYPRRRRGRRAHSDTDGSGGGSSDDGGDDGDGDGGGNGSSEEQQYQGINKGDHDEADCRGGAQMGVGASRAPAHPPHLSHTPSTMTDQAAVLKGMGDTVAALTQEVVALAQEVAALRKRMGGDGPTHASAPDGEGRGSVPKGRDEDRGTSGSHP